METVPPGAIDWGSNDTRANSGRAATAGGADWADATDGAGWAGAVGCGAEAPPPAPRNACTSSAATAKFKPVDSRTPYVATPTTFPSPSPTGPPELPWFIGASVWTCQ